MFDPRDLADDPRTRAQAKPVPTLDRSRKRADRRRSGYRAEYDPREGRPDIKTRMDRAVAEIGIYRSVAYKDMSEAHFDSHPYATRRAVDRMIQRGDVEEHTAKGPQGGTYKVLTLTVQGARRAEGVARARGLDKEQKAWSGFVKPAELEHDTAVFRAARIEQVKLIERGAVLKRVRIDAELKGEIARASETARAREGKEAADRARLAKARELGLPVKEGRVEIPDAQLEYEIDGRSGRVNVEVATGHYSAKSIAGKAASGFSVHASTSRASRRIARAAAEAATSRASKYKEAYAPLEDQRGINGHHPGSGPDDGRRELCLDRIVPLDHRRSLDAGRLVRRAGHRGADVCPLWWGAPDGPGRHGPEGGPDGAIHPAGRGRAERTGREDGAGGTRGVSGELTRDYSHHKGDKK